ncbi:unnamed protein product [Somion occarium]|uniref:Uncharacterized protein n=1 Tax=Somion occarium TaxID=3059160 RepID=A0ABP1DSX8_9APHY
MSTYGAHTNARYVHHENAPSNELPGPNYTRNEFDSPYMSPAANQYQTWTPALAPIVGSPSVPAATEVSEQDFDEMYEQEEREQEREQDPPNVNRDTIRRQQRRTGDIEQVAMPEPAPARSRLGNFVGGFMATLRHIPNAMVKNNPRNAIPAEYIGPGGEGSMVNSPRVSYYSSSPNPRNSRILSQGGETYTPYTHTTNMPVEEVPEPLDEDPRTTSSTAPASNAQELYDDGTTAVHHDAPVDSSVISSPAQIGREEISDYEKTRTPYPFTNPEDKSLTSYVDRIHRFFTDIRDLPWMTPQIANEYVPAIDSSRGRKRTSDQPVSWYKPRPKKEKQDSDSTSTLPVPSPPQIMIQTIPPTPTYSAATSFYNRSTVAPSDPRLTLTASQYTFRSNSRAASEGGATAIRPLRTPGTGTSVGGLPSPGASSHGMGNHSISYSYHYTSPPATHGMRGYPSAFSAVSSPQTRLESEGYFSPSVR